MNIKRWLSAIFIVLVVIAGLGFIKFKQVQAAIAFGESFPEPSASVKSTYAEPAQHTNYVKVVGQLHARKTITVSNEYSGLVTFVGFNPGDIVQAEQVLLKLDTSIDEANLRAAKARVKLAKSTYARVVKLLAQKRISPDEVDKAEADVSVGEADVQNLEALIAKKTIRAPFAGQTGLDQYQTGQFIDVNTAITSLVGLDDAIWVDFQVPQTLTQPTIGSAVNVSFIEAEQSNTLTATVIAKNPSLDINSRQQSYRALLTNPNNKYSHNQMATVLVPTAHLQAVMVPTNAITRSHFGEFVYVLEKDEQQNWRAKPVKVTLGDKVQDRQIVLSGLNGGEFIASEGAFKLKENLLVYIEQSAASEDQNGAQ
ncbi:efflux RND transporter periplasmic adaptor subunit [Pseudoalteromonas luteoviolacea]|uniref:efflux RND transporter periplasmic adaptor subunit n=1 Tax=Pseudoalteromonas luteoviolacea TaxID=43657 RepID=UPI001153A705|nr:efflux RND transporter periplasmic adaptor subunit [Pseudoalteromonas luteoviolacea]TQF67889.1 efflux RND transporter periplasmic adaptor subunit [Pseudoalteromonas luteoviolacea]